MKIVLDTNVLVSGIFFTGPPYEILKAWEKKKFHILITPDIFEEYQRVIKILEKQYPEIDISPVLKLIMAKSVIIDAVKLSEQVCEDPDDDKFIACAISGNSTLIVSGDKHLLKVSGYNGIKVIRPRNFIEEYLQSD
jgi:putative PIN family toxin of toxin-antitoxin system